LRVGEAPCRGGIFFSREYHLEFREEEEYVINSDISVLYVSLILLPFAVGIVKG